MDSSWWASRVAAGLATAGLAAGLWASFSSRERAGLALRPLAIEHPVSGAVFPQDIAPPVFRWTGGSPEVVAWRVEVLFGGQGHPLSATVTTPRWTPSEGEWQRIKSSSVSAPASVEVLGLGADHSVRCRTCVSFKTSKDPVGAPLFYREVPLPFSDAVKDPSRIRWRFGHVSSASPPPVVLENLPVCGNCHSFSDDGKVMGMDVDYANDKGSYVLSAVHEEMVLDPGKIITWSDYRRKDKETTFGLLSRVSPGGRFVVSTVKDRSVFIPRPNLEFSQLFFPIKGILVVHDREKKMFFPLPGADDPSFVQSNPAWSPDGREIVFARARVHKLRRLINADSALLTEWEGEEFISGGKTFQFDLYRIPFNAGRGGKPEPIDGASGDGLSNYFPKFSPDGKWIVFCKAKSFMLLQPDSELYIIPSAGGKARRLGCNTRRMNSWHSWSPNGRWLVFTSKANGPYSQLFLTHIDEQGQSSPPVELSHFTAPDRAANIPEFVPAGAGTIRSIREQFLDDYSHWRAGNEYARQRDWKGAATMYLKAVEINPRNLDALCALARVQLELSQLTEARRHLTTALEIDPKRAVAHALLGNAALREGKISDAVVQYRMALELDSKSCEAHNNLGLALAQQGAFDEAIAHHRRSLEINAGDPEAHNNLGLAMMKKGMVDEAIVHYQKALEIDPGYALAHYNFGVALSQAGRPDEAIGHYRRALEITPSFVDAHINLGPLLLQQGRVDEAIVHYQKALEIDSRNVRALNNLGTALLQKRKIDEAIAQYLKALEIDPAYVLAHVNLGVALVRAGRFDEAITHYARAIELDPNLAAAHHGLGEALWRKGRPREASSPFHETKAAHPENTGNR